ncbi:hypothetical protein OIO90_005842 [Microbotryomycetes sp. JL221]|nr:hypothetical protein OIO90_005842 [Microbotryomycetes sp. JL221]
MSGTNSFDDTTKKELASASLEEAKTNGVGLGDLEYTAEEDKALLRRIDWFLLPVCCFSYGIQFIDRTSLSSSAIFGLIEDNNLVGRQFSWLTTIFYLGYLVFEFPANWLMQKFEVGYVLSVLMFLWGAMVFFIAACKNFAQLAAVRFLLGAFESAISPGLLLIMAQFYTTREQTSRVLIYSSMNQLFASFTGVLVYLLGKNALDNPNTLAGWQQIHLLLGAITIASAILVFFFVRSIDRVWWLSSAQKQQAKHRVRANKTNTNEVHKWNWDQAKECMYDPQVWLSSLIVAILSVPNGGITSFAAQLIKSLGFSSLRTIILQIPMNVFGVSMFVVSIFTVSKFNNLRLYLCALWPMMTVVGLIAVVALPATPQYKWARYGCLFLHSLFSLAMFFVFGLVPSNVAGRTKKTVVSTLIFVMYCVGNLCGGLVFKPSDAPAFRTGLITCIACLFVSSCLALVLRVYYVRENKRRDAVMHAQGLTEEDRHRLGSAAGDEDLTDIQNKWFRYAV